MKTLAIIALIGFWAALAWMVVWAVREYRRETRRQEDRDEECLGT